MFYTIYKNKTNKELNEIVNSSSFQLKARETAKKILNERISYDKHILEDSKLCLSIYEIVGELKEYGLNVKVCSINRIITIYRDTHGLIVSIISGVLFLCLTLHRFYLLANDTLWFNEKWYYFLMVITFLLSCIQYYRDKMYSVVFNFNESKVEIKSRRIWNCNNKTYSIKHIEFRKIKWRVYQIYNIERNKIKVLFTLNGNNIGNKVVNYLSVLTKKMNDEINK